MGQRPTYQVLGAFEAVRVTVMVRRAVVGEDNEMPSRPSDHVVVRYVSDNDGTGDLSVAAQSDG